MRPTHSPKSHHLASPRHPKVFHFISGHDLAMAKILQVPQLWSCFNFSFGSHSIILCPWFFTSGHPKPTTPTFFTVPKFPTSPQTTSSKPCPLGHDPPVRVEDAKHPGSSTVWGSAMLCPFQVILGEGNHHWITESYTSSNSPQNPIENI